MSTLYMRVNNEAYLWRAHNIAIQWKVLSFRIPAHSSALTASCSSLERCNVSYVVTCLPVVTLNCMTKTTGKNTKQSCKRVTIIIPDGTCK